MNPTRTQIVAALRVIAALYGCHDGHGSRSFCPPNEFDPECICCIAGKLHETMTDYINSEDYIETGAI